MKVPELRRRILFTLAMIVVVRLGVQIPLPGIDVMELQKVIEASTNASGPGAGLATVLTIFSGGGLQQCGIFALGIMPYISASIMTQLLSAVVPQCTILRATCQKIHANCINTLHSLSRFLSLPIIYSSLQLFHESIRSHWHPTFFPASA